jgi:hypothetical protein
VATGRTSRSHNVEAGEAFVRLWHKGLSMSVLRQDFVRERLVSQYPDGDWKLDGPDWTKMMSFLSLLLHALAMPRRSRASLETEIVPLGHQLNVLRRQKPAYTPRHDSPPWLSPGYIVGCQRG